MKVLMINKFLHPNGGSETYIFKLGEQLEKMGHEVQYFGMEHEGRCVGNRVGAYTSDMDFHGSASSSGMRRIAVQLSYAVRTIYSREARRQIRRVLEDFKPDVCHLNNFNYQLTPSVILEIVKWRNDTGHKCEIIYTAHDYQLICPNHMMNNPATHENCEKCVGKHFMNCVRGKCIHGSTAKSFVGMLEASYWNMRGTYRYIDKIVCCSGFMKSKLDTNPLLADKTVAIHNFVDIAELDEDNEGMLVKNPYILYFGRFSWEKGVRTLIEAAKKMPDVQFVFAGSGDYADMIETVDNIRNVGFLDSKTLDKYIRGAYASVCPSECYENCPFSVMESQMRGTPVIGANIGGIPELVIDGVNGLLFDSGDADSLAYAIKKLFADTSMREGFSQASIKTERISSYEYAKAVYGV